MKLLLTDKWISDRIIRIWFQSQLIKLKFKAFQKSSWMKLTLKNDDWKAKIDRITGIRIWLTNLQMIKINWMNYATLKNEKTNTWFP